MHAQLRMEAVADQSTDSGLSQVEASQRLRLWTLTAPELYLRHVRDLALRDRNGEVDRSTLFHARSR
jgi:hypothetical protein